MFAAFAILLRWGSFFISVINHDESTYIVIADELLNGEVYLRDVIDTKPIGIFLVYAALIKLTGGAIWLLRLAAALVVALGGWGLYLASHRALSSQRAGIAAGLKYVLICSVFSYYGLSPNTEIFFNCLTIAAAGLAVAPRVTAAENDSFWHWPVAGLLLGLAMTIKPFAAAESLAIGLFLVWYYLRQGLVIRTLTAGTTLLLGFALPLLGVYLYYANLGMLDTLQFYLFEVNGAYPIELPWYLRLKYMGDYCLRFAPFVILGALSLVRSNGNSDRPHTVWTRFLLLSFTLVTMVVLITGKRFGHYQVQLHPLLAALAGSWWALGKTAFPALSWDWLKKYTPAILIGVGLIVGLAHFARFNGKDDKPTRIAAYMEYKLAPNETFFGLNGWQITYHLLYRDVPTPYVHSSLLFLDHHVRAFQVDELGEADRLLANPNLRYLMGRVSDPDADTPLSRRLLLEFSPMDTLPGEIIIYRRD
ncbi:glycosyltransferase family 39 protein [Lewinella sp. 4G2]|uniref:ArnT family glycosyltransferase n=1 Tax=Lewinella sp. 4G2 TaxID=1803372 RepID=UPI0018D3D5A5|nr:glycosyltransferase family 39 protein [Lewinella sp. 4G2]